MEFLDRLERDLLDAADREDFGEWNEDEVVEVAPSPRPSRRRHQRSKLGSAPKWRIAVAASAAVLSLAAAIGFVVQRNSGQPDGVRAEASGPVGTGGLLAPQFAPNAQPASKGVVEAAPSASAAPTMREALSGVEAPSSQSGQGSLSFNDGQSLTDSSGSTTKSVNGSSSTSTSLSNTVPQAHQIDFSKIERDGSIAITVPKGQFGNAASKLAFITDSAGGMVLSSQTFKNQSGTFTIRVPASKFDRMMNNSIQHLVAGTIVTSQTTKSSDVTASYIDLKERLSIALEHRAVLRRLFSKAHSPSQILQYQRLLEDVQLTIEQYQGQIRFINNQVAESTINVSIHEVGAPTPTTKPAVIKNPDLGHAWQHGIQGFLGVIGAVVIGLGYLIPIAALLALIWFLALTIRRRRAAPAVSGGAGE